MSLPTLLPACIPDGLRVMRGLCMWAVSNQNGFEKAAFQRSKSWYVLSIKPDVYSVLYIRGENKIT